ncbi:hypothetical protein [Azohydromonas australica]|uniref:hypothetical protein n=1 Tax=Azohydromonas australica TaxID=364039 RepID=UPI00048FD9CB|nr:hypothetical protein [Azohydromonas australica]
MPASGPDIAPGMAEKLCFLCSPEAHGGRAEPAKLIETHMSWIVLYGDEVFKLKKPVVYPFLDFSTVQARGRNAWEELRLNRRLAPDVYLGVLALRLCGGRFRLGPASEPGRDGDTVDWLVWMRRLPAQRMLDQLVKKGALRLPDVDRLAGTLAAFYRAAEAVPLGGGEYLDRARAEQRDNRAVMSDARCSDVDMRAVLDLYDTAIERHAGLLRDRADAGCIVDGHGDLRPEHVCLLDPPVVIDALEFQAAMRQVDPFDELAFLGLECTVLGAAWVGERLWRRTAAALGNEPPALLADFYTARRAVLRARLSVAHLLDARPRTPARWLPQGRQYLAQARSALQRLQAR